MSLPIAPTPKLNIKETEKFIERVAEDLKKPAYLIPTPRLKEVEKFLKGK